MRDIVPEEKRQNLGEDILGLRVPPSGEMSNAGDLGENLRSLN